MADTPRRISRAIADTAPPERLLSLDVFRGATVVGMILVNNPGDWNAIYPPLETAAWNGCTFTDLIFPFFLWIVGVALTLSFSRRLARGGDRATLLGHTLRRAAIIFGLGLFLNGFPFGLLAGHHFDLATWRIPGVLQRIALCYLVTSILVLCSGVRGRVVWLLLLLGGYWALLVLVPVPGFGPGILEPTGNLAWYIDSHLLAGHTWSGAPAPGFDPEGLLSTLGAIGTTLLGVLAGMWLQGTRSRLRTGAGLLAAGLLFLLLGLLLDRWLPINKNLWTSSYVVFTAGWAMTLLALLYGLIDVGGLTKGWTPLRLYGMNALVVFVYSGIVGRLLALIRVSDTGVPLRSVLFATGFAPFAAPRTASLLFAVAFLLTTWPLVWWLWRKGWFLRV